MTYIIAPDDLGKNLREQIVQASNRENIKLINNDRSPNHICNYAMERAEGETYTHSVFILDQNTPVTFSGRNKVISLYAFVILWDGTMENYQDWWEKIEPLLDDVGLARPVVMCVDLSGDFPHEDIDVVRTQKLDIHQVISEVDDRLRQSRTVVSKSQ